MRKNKCHAIFDCVPASPGSLFIFNISSSKLGLGGCTVYLCVTKLEKCKSVLKYVPPYLFNTITSNKIFQSILSTSIKFASKYLPLSLCCYKRELDCRAIYHDSDADSNWKVTNHVSDCKFSLCRHKKQGKKQEKQQGKTWHGFADASKQISMLRYVMLIDWLIDIYIYIYIYIAIEMGSDLLHFSSEGSLQKEHSVSQCSGGAISGHRPSWWPLIFDLFFTMVP